MNNEQRITWLDYTRGVAILLVILGHVLIRSSTSAIENKVLIIIYTFHMPLFFVLSGITFGGYSNKARFIKRKAKHLLIPAVVFSLLFFIFNAIFRIFTENSFDYNAFLSGNKIINIILMTNKSIFSQYWFLPTLFSVEIIMLLLISITTFKEIPYVILLCGVALAMAVKKNDISLPLGFGEALLALPYFYAGYSYKINGLKRYNNKTVIGLTLIFGFSLLLWSKMSYGIIDMYNSQIHDALLFYLLGLSGTNILIQIIMRYKGRKLRVLEMLGKHSLGVLFILLGSGFSTEAYYHGHRYLRSRVAGYKQSSEENMEK